VLAQLDAQLKLFQREHLTQSTLILVSIAAHVLVFAQ
jgi:hypothetical protein